MRTIINGLSIKVMAFLITVLLAMASSADPQSAELRKGNHMSETTTQSPISGVSFRTIESNGISMRVAEAGDSGPLLLLAHGWPESWYNWRHQITYFSNAGYRVIAPDMRGYGKTDSPETSEDFDIVTLAADMVGILDAYGEETAIMVGHDWGSIVAWQTVLLHPDRFSALIAMSVPYGGRPAESPMLSWRESYGDNFYYILYHNEAGGVAEAEYDSDPEGLLSRLYLSPNSPRQAPLITNKKRSAGGWIGRLGAPMGLPDWLKQEDLDYVVGQFKESGFRGGMNYYRNFHRNWEITEHLQEAKITVPTLFIAGSDDMVIAHATQGQLNGAMSRIATDFRGAVLIPGIGHWLQQEAPDETNKAMMDFLKSL
jgi:pimeloyl-ACP methyl ester carboxylesterase